MNIVCAGDCGVDNYSDLGVIKPGGIALNVAVHLRRILTDKDTITVVGALGDDENAEIVNKSLSVLSIQNRLAVLPGQTPVQYISNTAAGEKMFTKYEEGVLENFTISKEQTTFINQSDLLISPLFNQIEPFFNSVIRIKNKGMHCADFLDLTDFDKKTAIVEKYINYLDVAFFGLNKTDVELINSLQHISNYFEKLFVITLGSEGSIAFFDGKNYTAKSKKTDKVVDTTGAGDAFAAAFLCEYIRNKDIQKSLNTGSHYASKIVQHLGGF